MQRVLPILFNTDMVRAILDERKTVTRRCIKKLPDDAEFFGWLLDSTCQEDAKDIGSVGFKTLKHPTEKAGCIFVKPPYQPGDYIYVRETWNYVYDMDENDQIIEGTGRYIYYSDDPMPFSHWVDTDTGEHKEQMPWRPSIHMPKEAARIWLKVTNVRVERLQDITEEQAYMEGTDPWDDACYVNNGWHPTLSDPDSGGEPNIIDGFQKLWNSTLKKSDLDRYGWEANPWVWVIEFERCEKPEREG